jgi:hypothetical protein
MANIVSRSGSKKTSQGSSGNSVAKSEDQKRSTKKYVGQGRRR